MNKTVIAMAVAGALAAPATALAQTTIYGYFNVEWGVSVDQPADGAGAERHTGDFFNSGASRIGFRGEEKMGGGNAAWYQCETELGLYPRDTGVVVCDRNSAVGLKGGWGNFFVGSWDSPLKRVSGIVRITNETGFFGTQDLTLRAGTFGLPNFSNRNTNSFNYDTPNMGGFMASVQTTTTQAKADAVEVAGTSLDGRISTISGQWLGGPAAIVAGYSKKDKNRSAGGIDSAEDTAYLVGGSYVIGPVKVGLTFTNRESDDGAGSNIERNAYNVAGDWKIGGPSTIRVGYTAAQDLKGTGAITDSGAVQYSIQYIHALSKRTNVAIGYVKVDNDTNGTANLTDGSTDVLPGDSASAVALTLQHTF
jgi:predicted porin